MSLLKITINGCQMYSALEADTEIEQLRSQLSASIASEQRAQSALAERERIIEAQRRELAELRSQIDSHKACAQTYRTQLATVTAERDRYKMMHRVAEDQLNDKLIQLRDTQIDATRLAAYDCALAEVLAEMPDDVHSAIALDDDYTDQSILTASPGVQVRRSLLRYIDSLQRTVAALRLEQ